MTDALLLATRDAIYAAGMGYGEATCAVMADGHPPPRCGDVFVAVHEGPERSLMDNALDDYFDFALTLTMRVNVPLDRVGDRLLARKVARKVGFNARAEQLRALLHMAWDVLQAANQYLVDLNPEATLVYGFAEPARYRGREIPVLVGGEWFEADPEALEVGLKSELRFEDARRLQAIGSFV